MALSEEDRNLAQDASDPRMKPNLCIYVVDDHPIMRDAIASVARRLRNDVTVIEFGSLVQLTGDEAASRIPHLIVLDLNLPGAQGCSGILQVRRLYPNAPLVVCSASPASEMRQPCMDAGADLYIEKAGGLQPLTAAVRMLLAVGEDDDSIGFAADS